MQYLIPIKENEQIKDGTFIKALDYCKKHCNSGECKRFYQGLSTEHYNTFFTCPHGMTVYYAHSDEKSFCFTCMRGRGTYQKEKAKRIDNSQKENIVYNPVLESDRLSELINYSLQVESGSIQLEEKRASIDSISHEVKKLNAQIKDRSDAIIQAYADESIQFLDKSALHDLIERIKTIYVCSAMINTRFSLFDYEKNSHILAQGAAFDCNIYKKFDKMRIIFSNYLGRKVSIVLIGSSYRCFWAYPTFEMIPLLLIDNAIKYSYVNNPVEIVFNEAGDKLIVDIKSYSPYCSKTDIENIFQKGFRGKNAIKVADGSGIGLFFVKLLCDLHNIQITISSDNSKVTEINGVAYAPFNAQLVFSDTH